MRVGCAVELHSIEDEPPQLHRRYLRLNPPSLTEPGPKPLAPPSAPIGTATLSGRE